MNPGQSCPESVPLTTVLSCSMRGVTALWGPGVPSPPSESAPFPVTTCHRRREAPQKPAVLGAEGDKCVCACVLVIVHVTGSHTSILVSACQGHDGAGFGVTCDVSLVSISLCVCLCVLSVTVCVLSLYLLLACPRTLMSITVCVCHWVCFSESLSLASVGLFMSLSLWVCLYLSLFVTMSVPLCVTN